MPDLNKQTLINLLIDSPLREPIKINLIDIVNNTKDEDLPKTFSTISKELEIYSKATNRRLKLADEISKKLNSETPNATSNSTPNELPSETNTDEIATPELASKSTSEELTIPQPPTQESTPASPTPSEIPNEPAVDTEIPTSIPTQQSTLDPMAPDSPISQTPQSPSSPEPLSAPQNTPTPPTTESPSPSLNTNMIPPADSSDTDDAAALAEIQKELNNLKNSASEDATQMEPTTEEPIKDPSENESLPTPPPQNE